MSKEFTGVWPFRRPVWHGQRGEDRALARLFGRRRRGFYIDIGAWDPVKDSVTKHFYDRGWRGINVEPHPEYFGRLVAARPRDVNLQLALGDEAGTQSLILIGQTGLSTFVAPFADYAQAWARENAPEGADVAELSVEVTTLAEVCRRHIPPATEIDFLKIDVEGWEERVLRGGDWTAFRPRILVVEAVEPLTETPAWATWDPYIQAQGYDFLTFDGLNRWYRRREDASRAGPQ
jgi:FkbM family methyltransferase